MIINQITKKKLFKRNKQNLWNIEVFAFAVQLIT